VADEDKCYGRTTKRRCLAAPQAEGAHLAGWMHRQRSSATSAVAAMGNAPAQASSRGGFFVHGCHSRVPMNKRAQSSAQGRGRMGSRAVAAGRGASRCAKRNCSQRQRPRHRTRALR
jgi:hypothetical protein